MNTPFESTSGSKTTEKAEAAETCFPAAFATLFTNGMERAAEIGKASLDLAANQNAEIVDTCKKMVRLAPSTPGIFLFDLAGQAFHSYVDMQKNVLDLVLQQSRAMADATYERGATASEIAQTLSTTFRETLEQSVAAHKAVVDFAASQNKVIGEAISQQPGIAGTPLAAATESIQRSMDAVLEAQKEMVQVATAPLKAAAAKAS